MSYSEKIYPEVPSAPPESAEGQTYRLKKIGDIESFLRSEITYRSKLTKRCKRRAATATISDTSVITAITALEVTSVITLTTGVGIPVSIALASVGLLLGLSSAIVHKVQKLLASKAKKHDKIKILAEAKLDSISSLVSKAVEDANISHEEYQFILKEVEHYRNLKEQIRAKYKRVVDVITAEQREALLAEGRKQGKQDFLQQIARSSAIPPVNAT